MNLLIIDDDPDDTSIFCEALREVFPHAVCTLRNSCKGIEAELNNLPAQDAIFLDAHMFPSAKDCVSIFQKVVDTKITRIYIYTGAISPAEAAGFCTMGVAGVINKTESFSALKATLLELFG